MKMPSEMAADGSRRPRTYFRTLLKKSWRDRYIFILLLPGLLYFLLFKIIPVFGNVIAFQDYNPFKGMWASDWVGLSNFKRIFEDTDVLRILRNTLFISLMQIIFVFPAPILLAIMLNEVAREKTKRLIQSIIYLPHFFSWVVIVSIATIFLKPEGLINQLLQYFGYDWISFMTNPHLFVPIVIIELIWKETGWSTIIFLAALASINHELLEAAIVDGANRWKRIWHIIVPSIGSTIAILLILRLGTVLDTGFEQIFLMLNPFNRDIGEVLDTYVYTKGIKQGDFSFSTAVGLFKGVVGLVLVLTANRIIKKSGNDGLF
ncbi:ABC transporter permease [Cohnella hashimotonis]|uniref:ABC transporter permease subunit n=1 Tax=Cohnella hashimotonis TaxID=2826895 RepID=A0ABT6TDW5_9BACL|nr:ABC transporter permease subunit [Cohnella hashimotonis]MDI4645000.1 ABC transporter permease subunit [Cohnella hashimotonis]